MGLDMYLTARISVYGNKTKQDELLKLFPDLKEVKLERVSGEIGYWRKQNAIHKWFVNECQDGEDKCQKTEIEIEELKKLKRLCKRVLKDLNKAAKLLPTGDGFFFGRTEYDEWYVQGLTDTIEIIKKCEKLHKKYKYDVTFEYQASW